MYKTYTKHFHYSLFFFVFIWLLVFISNIFTPLTNDFFVFYAYGQQVKLTNDTGLLSLISTWDMKGILSRALFCELYDLTNWFYPDFDLNGQRIYKLFGLLQYQAFIAIALIALPKSFMEKKNKWIVFFIISSLLLSAHFSCTLQMEFWAIPILLLSTSLLLHNTLLTKILSGIIFCLLFYLKTPLLLLGGSLFLGVMMLRKENFTNTLRFFIPFIVTVFITMIGSLLYLYIFYPQEIKDIIDASWFQDTLIHKNIIEIFKSMAIGSILIFKRVLYIPIFLLSCILLIIFFQEKISKKEFKKAITILLLYVFPFLYILISNKFFQYHYFVFAYPCIILLIVEREHIYDFCYQYKKWYYIIPLVIIAILSFFVDSQLYSIINKHKTIIFFFTAIALFLLFFKKTRCIANFFLFALSIFVYISFISGSSYTVRQMCAAYKSCLDTNAHNNYKIGTYLGDEDVLYLDGGIGAFYFTNKSYLRYFYPLPIQRIADNSAFTQSETYKKIKEKILNYNGQYIILDETWFYAISPHKDIANFITNNYYPNNSISVSFTFFSWEFFDPTPYSIKAFYILQKKIPPISTSTDKN